MSTQPVALKLQYTATPVLRVLVFAILFAAALLVLVHAGGVMPKIEEAHVGVCRLDSAVLTCIHRNYPKEFYFAIFMACLLASMELFKRRD